MPATLTPLVKDQSKTPEELGHHLLHGPPPPPWAVQAFVLATKYLRIHLERNTSVLAEEAFGGAKYDVGGRIILFAHEGGLAMPDSVAELQKSVGVNPLAVVAYLATGVNVRVNDLAEHFHSTKDVITEMINESDSGMKVVPGGWVKLEES